MAPRKPAYTGRAYQPSLFGRGRGPKLKPEEALQITIVEWMRAVAPKLKVIHIPNEGQRTSIAKIILKRMALTKGAADLLVIAPAPVGALSPLIFFFEVKTKGQYPNAFQRQFLIDVQELGCIGAVTRSIEDTRTVLLEHGVHMREHVSAKQLALI